MMLPVARATVLAVAAATVLGAQDAPLEIARLAGPIQLDGVPNEAAWRSVAPLPLTMYAPVFRGTPSQRSEIRVAHDDEYFWFAGWFWDTDPSGIRINSLYRDRWNGDDAFAIYIDAFNDNRNSQWFGVTPAGMRFDLLVSDDGDATNSNWDAFWSAQTTVTDSGWFVEVRIPFSTLGFHAAPDGRAVMGLTVTRLVSRLGERVTFPAIDTRDDFRRPSLGHDVVLRDVRTRAPLYVIPYVVGGAARSNVPLTPSGFARVDDRSSDAGLDVRYPFTSQLNLDVTVNTDFAQVEADDQQVNLDRFPLFFPDRRRFFQERSEVFDFLLGGDARLFHSRRIGLTSTGAPVPIVGGARLTGRAAGWDIGTLGMQTRAEGATPAETFAVARVRRGVLNPYSSMGAMITGYGGGSRQNVALAADGVIRLAGDHYVTTRVASTVDDLDPADVSLTSRSLATATLQRRVQRGFAYTVSAIHSGRDFRPELGFLNRRNFTTANAVFNHYIFTDRHAVLRRVYPGALAFSTWRNSDHALESGQYAVWVQWDTKRGGGGWLEPKLFRENVLTSFTIGNRVTIPAGDYTFADFQAFLYMNQGRRLRTGMDFRSGTYFDGRRTQLILQPTWNASKHLELGADYQLSALRFPVRGESVNIHVARVRARTAFNAHVSANTFVQYNSTTDRLDMNARFRWALSEGTDLWLVYNEGLDTERTTDAFGVTSPRSLARTFILKYSHALTF